MTAANFADAHGITEETPPELIHLAESHGGIVVRMEHGSPPGGWDGTIVHGDSAWYCHGWQLRDLGPSYGPRPENHAIGSESVQHIRIGLISWAWIPGPDVFDRLRGD